MDVPRFPGHDGVQLAQVQEPEAQHGQHAADFRELQVPAAVPRAQAGAGAPGDLDPGLWGADSVSSCTPDWTWDTAAAGAFDAGWARTFDEVRADDSSAVVQGPSYSTYNASWMTTFLTDAKASGTLPNIISWHELDGAGSIPADVASIESIESSLGISARPIAIEEYAESSLVGIPGDLVGDIANFERSGVNNAELAFRNEYGTPRRHAHRHGRQPERRLLALPVVRLDEREHGNGRPPGSDGVGLDGAASVNSAGNQVSVIFGGGSGSTAVTVNGLSSLSAFGPTAHAVLEQTVSAGTSGSGTAAGTLAVQATADSSSTQDWTLAPLPLAVGARSSR
jgi:hypothetical protein